MNTSIIRYILGQVLKVESMLMILPCIVALIYGEDDIFAYLIVIGITGLLGILSTIKKPESNVFYLKEGCVTTALSWIVISIFGSLPFIFTGDIPSFTDALFETISGFTTTGSSILTNVEALSHTNLFWRSFTHWVGGMGVLVFVLAIIPLSGGSNINIMRAESPGPSVGKIVPKIRETARILYLIYLGMTVVEIILLLLGGMPGFDAVTLSFGSAGTGGFGIKADSCASYSPYCQWVITIAMIMFGVNFNAYYFILLKDFKNLFNMEEVKCYFMIIFSAIAIIMINVSHLYKNIFTALRHTAFTVGSIITTTGYATADFDKWSGFAKFVLVAIMFVGACAGSTGGGIKVSRIIMLFKGMLKELNSYIHPKSVKKIKFDGKPIEHEVVRATNAYFITFIFLFALSIFAISFEGYGATTSFTSVAATINNIGPGLSLVGPTGNFGFFSNFSKYVLMFDMLAGRLELFPLLIMFHPAIWSDLLTKVKVHKKR
ncbi:MAG: TrkH family potassium uptake protein [Lachnospiraceae bacterium]|nr:TrkH family potassium uptake protein [Lachnospiraceae bacterium]